MGQNKLGKKIVPSESKLNLVSIFIFDFHHKRSFRNFDCIFPLGSTNGAKCHTHKLPNVFPFNNFAILCDIL